MGVGKPTCESCEFCVAPRPGKPGKGSCHRYPPTINRTMTEWQFPEVDLKKHWCGEHASGIRRVQKRVISRPLPTEDPTH